ncbi:MAG: ABC transporter substrate-binding protein [Actinomycetes bacterium]
MSRVADERGGDEIYRQMCTVSGMALPIAVSAGALAAAGCGSSDTTTSASPTPSSSGSAAATWGQADLAALQADPALTAMLPTGMTEIRAASDIPYPPWEHYDPATSKNPAGFDFDLSQAIGKKIGIPTSFNATPFDSIILSLKGSKNDMILSDMCDNLEREQQVISFVDYAYDGTSILVTKGNPNGVTNLDSLAGKTVATLSGGTQQQLLQRLNEQFKSAGKPEMTILAPQGQPAALLAVTSGRAVADLTDHTTASYVALNTNDGNTFEVIADPDAPNGYEPQVVGIGILKTNTALIDTVQKALQALIDEGAYAKTIAKYGLLPVQSAQIDQGGAPTPSPSTAP